MANTKISALSALTGANVEHTADSIAIVDDSVTTTKKILVSEIAKALEVLATEQASTSGTSIDFSSIPAWVKRITVMFDVVSISGTSNILIQIGDSGGLETTSYASSSIVQVSNASNNTAVTSTSGYVIQLASASVTLTGKVVLSLMDTSNTWVMDGSVLFSSNNLGHSAGVKTLSATLDRLRVTTTNGSDTFDAGAINILYE